MYHMWNGECSLSCQWSGGSASIASKVATWRLSIWMRWVFGWVSTVRWDCQSLMVACCSAFMLGIVLFKNAWN